MKCWFCVKSSVTLYAAKFTRLGEKLDNPVYQSAVNS